MNIVIKPYHYIFIYQSFWASATKSSPFFDRAIYPSLPSLPALEAAPQPVWDGNAIQEDTICKRM